MAISGEALSGLPANAVQDLKNLCDPYAADYRIIVYVRDPYEYANSAFLQHLKDGITLSQPGVIPLPKYRSKIEKYIKVFGRENVNIRVFAPHRFAGGNLISDFMTALDEPAAAADGMHITRANEALSHEAAIILSQANEAIPVYVDGRANRARAYGFHARLFGVKGEKFSVDPDVYLKHKADILADIEWLHRCAGESIFGDPALREPSRPRWSVDTVESIKQAVRDMVSTIRKLQSAPRPGIWQSLFQKRSEVPWRSLEKKDFSQALPSDLDDVVVPAELEWLREAISQRNAPQESIVPQFDEATIRSLACFIHSLALTIERLKAARAARPSLLRRLGIGR